MTKKFALEINTATINRATTLIAKLNPTMDATKLQNITFEVGTLVWVNLLNEIQICKTDDPALCDKLGLPIVVALPEQSEIDNWMEQGMTHVQIAKLIAKQPFEPLPEMWIEIAVKLLNKHDIDNVKNFFLSLRNSDNFFNNHLEAFDDELNIGDIVFMSEGGLLSVLQPDEELSENTTVIFGVPTTENMARIFNNEFTKDEPKKVICKAQALLFQDEFFTNLEMTHGRAASFQSAVHTAFNICRKGNFHKKFGARNW